jgi:uncharacterized membrane protein
MKYEIKRGWLYYLVRYSFMLLSILIPFILLLYHYFTPPFECLYFSCLFGIDHIFYLFYLWAFLLILFAIFTAVHKETVKEKTMVFFVVLAILSILFLFINKNVYSIGSGFYPPGGGPDTWEVCSGVDIIMYDHRPVDGPATSLCIGVVQEKRTP